MHFSKLSHKVELRWKLELYLIVAAVAMYILFAVSLSVFGKRRPLLVFPWELQEVSACSAMILAAVSRCSQAQLNLKT